jgi:hypothetical protein
VLRGLHSRLGDLRNVRASLEHRHHVEGLRAGKVSERIQQQGVRLFVGDVLCLLHLALTLNLGGFSA